MTSIADALPSREQMMGALLSAKENGSPGELGMTLTFKAGERATIGLLGDLFKALDGLLAAIERETMQRKRRRIDWQLVKFDSVMTDADTQVVSFTVRGRPRHPDAAKRARATEQTVSENTKES